MKKKKFKCALSTIDDRNATAIDWNLIGSEIMSNVKGMYLYNVLAINEEGEFVDKTVVFLVPISRIKSGSKTFEDDNLILCI